MTTVSTHPHREPAGLAWQAKLDAAWEAATSEAEWLATRPGLPDFNERRSAHVTGPVLGAYCYDPTANVVHRVATATPTCRLDDLDPRVFVHFWHEVQAHHPDATTCPDCLPAVKGAKP